MQSPTVAVILLDCQRADCLTEEQSVASGVIDSPVCHSVSMWNFFSIITTRDGYGWTFYHSSTCLACFDATQFLILSAADTIYSVLRFASILGSSF